MMTNMQINLQLQAKLFKENEGSGKLEHTSYTNQQELIVNSCYCQSQNSHYYREIH